MSLIQWSGLPAKHRFSGLPEKFSCGTPKGRLLVPPICQSRFSTDRELSILWPLGPRMYAAPRGNAGSPSDGDPVQVLRDTRLVEAIAHGWRRPLPLASSAVR